MTTIFAIKTNHDGIEGIVMGADTQLSIIVEDDLPEKKPKPIYKIIAGDKWMMGHAGLINFNLSHFNDYLLSQKGRVAIEKAIRNHKAHYKKSSLSSFLRANESVIDFPLITQLSALTIRNEEDKSEREHYDFILATKFSDELSGFWYIDSYGVLRDPDEAHGFKYACIGAESKKIKEYVNDKLDEEINISVVDIREAITIVERVFQRAQKDILTSSALLMSPVILTEHGAESYGEKIIGRLNETRTSMIDEIKAKYSLPPYVPIVLAEQPVKEEQKS